MGCQVPGRRLPVDHDVQHHEHGEACPKSRSGIRRPDFRPRQGVEGNGRDLIAALSGGHDGLGRDATLRTSGAVPLRQRKYPYCQLVVGNNPERFERLCKLAADFIGNDRKHPPAVFVNAWNEWAEGFYLLPEEKYGTAYLQVLQQVSAGDSRRMP